MCKCSEVNFNGDVSIKVRCLNFGQSLHLHLFFVYASREGSDQSAHMLILCQNALNYYNLQLFHAAIFKKIHFEIISQKNKHAYIRACCLFRSV